MQAGTLTSPRPHLPSHVLKITLIWATHPGQPAIVRRPGSSSLSSQVLPGHGCLLDWPAGKPGAINIAVDRSRCLPSVPAAAAAASCRFAAHRALHRGCTDLLISHMQCITKEATTTQCRVLSCAASPATAWWVAACAVPASVAVLVSAKTVTTCEAVHPSGPHLLACPTGLP